jgi:putative aminopeptidase FrvX
MTQERLLELLRELLPAHSPVGEEAEVDRILIPHFERHCRDVRQDAAENILGLVRGTGERPAVMIAAHKDELGMIVKRVDPDGGLCVEALGGVPPWKYGEGPVEILARDGPVTGVMSVGSLHTTEKDSRVGQAREHPLEWSMVRVWTNLPVEELEARGIGPGTRIALARERKGPVLMNGCVCGFGLDDKASLAVMLEAMSDLAQGPPPAQDVYFVATSAEEQTGCGGTVSAGHLPIDTMLALEIGPVAAEYGLKLDARPIIWYRDSTFTYSKRFCDELAALGDRIGTGIQKAVYTHASSDASCARATGEVGRIACLSFPAINTHGFEVAPLQGILNMHRILMAYLRGGELERGTTGGR